MRRRKLLAAVGLAVLVAAGAFVLWPRLDRITDENFDRIQEGMSRAEVEAIFGGPPGDYRAGPTTYDADLDANRVPREILGLVRTTQDGDDVFDWAGDHGHAIVVFDSTGIYRDGWFHSTQRVHQTPPDMLLWRLKRQWRRWFPE
jgi:hypothetical protein